MGTFSSLLLIITLVTRLLGHSHTMAPIIKNRFYYEKRGEIVWEVPNDEKVIALTFDDGPDPEDTPKILDLLQKYDVKATFFVVGKKVVLHPELVRRATLEGHEIANHTYNHIYFTKRMAVESIQKEILKAEQTIYRTTGTIPTLFRPPGGFYSENVIRAAHNAGYQLIMWSWHQDSKDWNRPGVNKIVSSVLEKTRNGDIVLLHDYVEGDSQTIAALKQILPTLKKRGYKFVTVSDLLTYR